MSICPSCGTRVEPAQPSCSSCGARLDTVVHAAPRVMVTKGDTGVDRSVTTIDASSRTSTVVHDHRQDSSQRTETTIGSVGAVIIGGAAQADRKSQPCPVCGRDLGAEEVYRCPGCGRDMCRFHATAAGGRCRQCETRAGGRRVAIGLSVVVAAAAIGALAWLGRDTEKSNAASAVAAGDSAVGSIAEPSRSEQPTLKPAASQSPTDASQPPAVVAPARGLATPPSLPTAQAAKAGASPAAGTNLTGRPFALERPTRAPVDAARYVNRSSFDPDRTAVLIVTDAGSVDRELSQELAAALGGHDALFKAAFVADGLFRRAHDGDGELLQALGLSAAASRIVLGIRRATASQQEIAGQELMRVETTIALRIFELGGAQAADNRRATGLTERGIGAGFSRDEAERNANEAVVKKVAGRLAGLR